MNLTRRIRYFSAVSAMSAATVLAGCASTQAESKADAGLTNTAIQPTRMITTAVGKLATYDFAGPGPTLLLWPSLYTDHHLYRKQVLAFQGKYRLILVDGPGHGASEPPSALFSLADCGEAMRAVLDAYQVPRAVVGGVSWGGLAGIEFAARYPQRTQGLIAMNTPIDFPADGAGITDKMIVLMTRLMGSSRFLANNVARSFFAETTRQSQPELIDAFAASLAPLQHAGLARAIESVLVARQSQVPLLSKISAPALVLAGSEDSMYPEAAMRELSTKMPKGSFVVIPNTAHLSALEAPVPVNQAIEQFVARLQ